MTVSNVLMMMFVLVYFQLKQEDWVKYIVKFLTSQYCSSMIPEVKIPFIFYME